MSTEDYGFDNLKADGLLGLGFRSESDNCLTFIDNLKSRQQISKRIFSIYLANNDIYNSNSSFITFGGYDSKNYGTEGMKTINIMKGKNFWCTTVDKIISGGRGIKLGQRAIIDSASSIIAGPRYEVELISEVIYNSVNGCY